MQRLRVAVGVSSLFGRLTCMSELSRVDWLLLERVGVEPISAMAERTGLSESEVAARINKALGEVDILSVAQKRVLLMHKLQRMMAQLEDRITDLSGRDLGPAVNSYRGLIATVLKELRDMEAADKARVEQVESRYAALFAEIAGRAMQSVIDKFEGVDSEIVEATYRAELERIAQEYDVEG